jgi:hypothetical protein
MNKYNKLIFWILLAGLILFTVAFGMPFLAHINSSRVLTLAGCELAGFDKQASCPEGVNFAARFIPLNHWMSLFLAPMMFIKQFWDILLAWISLIAYFGYNAIKRRQSFTR